jgi:two-component system, NarL family, nitrate/nitrite response regulator NarL
MLRALWRHGRITNVINMNAIIVTNVRLLGDSLCRCLEGHVGIRVIAVVAGPGALHEVLVSRTADIVLIDVLQGVDLYEMRKLMLAWPELPLVALGIDEERSKVVRCGQAGFAGYISRDATIESMCATMADVVAGRLACPAHISGGLLRALFRNDPALDPISSQQGLTRREIDVLRLIGEGMTNKEIARSLDLSVATVKHHVHNVLDKLSMTRRVQAMHHVREAFWLTRAAPLEGALDVSSAGRGG